jgi:hypothetical protein
MAQFLATPAGKVAILRGRAIHHELLVKASEDLFHTSHSSGAAKGFGDCLEWLQSLSRSARATAGSEPDTEGQTNDTSPPGETELRERMSP